MKTYKEVVTSSRKYYAEQFDDGMAWGCTDGEGRCLGTLSVFGCKTDRDDYVSAADKPAGAKRDAVYARHVRAHGYVYVNGIEMVETGRILGEHEC